jgi:hypothetical protein
MYTLATAPQSIGGVLDSGFKLFTACLSRTFLLAAFGTLLSAPLNMAAPWLAGTQSTGNVLALVLAFLILIALTLAVTGALIARIDAIAKGGDLPLSSALGVGARRGPALFICGVCYALVVAIGMVLLIIPGLYLMVSLVFGLYAVVTERLGPIASLSYSRGLVRGHWWRTAAILTIIGIILIVLYIVLGLVVGIVVATNPETVETGVEPWYVSFVFAPLLAGVVTPLAYSLLLAALYDLKLRHEGGDLAERIAAVT